MNFVVWRFYKYRWKLFYTDKKQKIKFDGFVCIRRLVKRVRFSV